MIFYQLGSAQIRLVFPIQCEKDPIVITVHEGFLSVSDSELT